MFWEMGARACVRENSPLSFFVQWRNRQEAGIKGVVCFHSSLLSDPVARTAAAFAKRANIFAFRPAPPAHILPKIKLAKKTQLELYKSQSSTRYRKGTKGSVKNSCWWHRERNLAPLLSLWFPCKKKNPLIPAKKSKGVRRSCYSFVPFLRPRPRLRCLPPPNGGKNFPAFLQGASRKGEEQEEEEGLLLLPWEDI